MIVEIDTVQSREIAHFTLALDRIEEGEGKGKRVRFETSPQVMFRPERLFVRAHTKPGWLERATRAFGWFRIPWVERRWEVPNVELSAEEIEEMLDDGDDSYGELEDLLDEETVGGGLVDGNHEDDEERDEEGLPDDIEPKRRWRFTWLRPFETWRMRIAQREQQKKFGRCFLRDIVVDGQRLMVPGGLVPIGAFLETAIGTQIDAPACRAGMKIQILLEGEVPDMAVMMIGISPIE